MKLNVKLTPVFLVLGLAAGIYADAAAPRISNELASIKACSALSKEAGLGFSLAEVLDASVEEQGQKLKVEIKWRRGHQEQCISYQWFDFTGSPTTCNCGPETSGSCMCPGTLCKSSP